MHDGGHCLKSSRVSNGDFLFINVFVLFSLIEGLLSTMHSLIVLHSRMREHPRN